MRGSRIPLIVTAIALAVAATPAAAFNCYLIVDRTNEIVYQGALSPIDLSEDGKPARDVAQELGLSVNAVLIAKSRVLGRLRQEARGLVD